MRLRSVNLRGGGGVVDLSLREGGDLALRGGGDLVRSFFLELPLSLPLFWDFFEGSSSLETLLENG